MPPTNITPRPAKVTKRYIKLVAGRKIRARLPGWKQNNLQAQAAVLNKKRVVSSLDSTDLANEAAMEAEWAWVAEMRAHSDDLEEKLELGTLPLNWENVGWPT